MKYPLADLTAAMGRPDISAKELAPLIGATQRTVVRWRNEGVPEVQADRAATRVGIPTRFVWPYWGDDPLPVCPGCGEAFTPHREGQRSCSRACAVRLRDAARAAS